MNDLIKAIAVLLAYGVLGPVLGVAIARSRAAQRMCLCLMLFMTSWFPSKLTLMLGSIEWYRGHTKGFEFSLIEVLAIALLVAARRNRPEWSGASTPGKWLWLGYCAACLLSLLAALDSMFSMMSFVKFAKITLIYAAAFQWLRDEEDLHWLWRTTALMLMLQAAVGLKMRFLDGRWQVHGWFEHQNPMAMWVYVCALPLLAGALAPQTGKRDALLYLVGFTAGGLLILLAVSRAALAAFVIGAVLVTMLAALRGLSGKVVGVSAVGVIGAGIVGLVAMDSFAARVAEAKSSETDLRAILIVQCKAMLADSPVGVGWNNYGIANSRPRGKYSEIIEDWDQSRGFAIYDENYYANALTESLYWLILAETGYPGFVMFLLFLLATLWWSVRGTIRYRHTLAGCFAGGLMVVLLLLYSHGTVERILTQTKNISEWFIFLGCLAKIEWCRRRNLELPERAG